jgi:hypothetical protein
MFLEFCGDSRLRERKPRSWADEIVTEFDRKQLFARGRRTKQRITNRNENLPPGVFAGPPCYSQRGGYDESVVRQCSVWLVRDLPMERGERDEPKLPILDRHYEW